MNKNVLTKEAQLDLRHMFQDAEFVALLFTDEKEIANYIHVDETGTVTLGKTKYKLINRLFRDEKLLSTNDVCLRLIDIITGKGGARNKEAFKCLIDDLTKALENKDYSYAITRIFIAYRLGFKNDVAQMTKVIDQKKDEKNKVNSHQYVIAQDGMGFPYAIRLGKY